MTVTIAHQIPSQVEWKSPLSTTASTDPPTTTITSVSNATKRKVAPLETARVVVMLFGIGFLSVLTATVASYFVKTDRGDETKAILAALGRLEAEMVELKRHVAPTE